MSSLLAGNGKLLMQEGETMAGETSADALWYTAAGEATIRKESLPALRPGQLRVRSLASGISRGTESLIFHGRVPESEYQRMRAPHQAGDFPFPVKYGYASVGTVVAGPAGWLGKTVFALFPHQTLFDIPVEDAFVVPQDVPPQRAVLAANMEAALTAVWDLRPAPGDHIGVVGGGVLGALAAWLARGIVGCEVQLVDVNPEKAKLAARLGVDFALPEDARPDNDRVIHASASEQVLQTALSLAGLEATIVELSWFGTRPARVELGGAFHSRRLRLVSSQVGRIPPHQEPRWGQSRRKELALRLLADARLDALIEAPVAFDQLPARLPELLADKAQAMCQVVTYPPADAGCRSRSKPA